MKEQGPELLSEVLARLFTARGWGRRQGQTRVEEAWRNAVGEPAAGNTRVIVLRRAVLEILVGDAVLMQELASFRRKSLIVALQNLLGRTVIKDLRFRLGSVQG